ncbi:MAG: imelysin family protein, partial [Solirubrobacteraceae bacterium]
TTAMHEKAQALDGDAKAWSPTREDVFNAVVVMTPTMSEYFEAWKNSRFVAGDDADESGFVGASRLSDIVDILSGLQVVYAGIRPVIAEEDEARATQTGRSLDKLVAFVTDIRDREAKGETFKPEQADAFGTNAQDQAEAIAGQVSQAAAALGIKLEDA